MFGSNVKKTFQAKWLIDIFRSLQENIYVMSSWKKPFRFNECYYLIFLYIFAQETSETLWWASGYIRYLILCYRYSYNDCSKRDVMWEWSKNGFDPNNFNFFFVIKKMVYRLLMGKKTENVMLKGSLHLSSRSQIFLNWTEINKSTKVGYGPPLITQTPFI